LNKSIIRLWLFILTKISNYTNFPATLEDNINEMYVPDDGTENFLL